MPLITNNFIVIGNNAGNLVVNNGIVDLPEPTKEPPKSIITDEVAASTDKVKTVSFDNEHHILMINGKQK